MPDVVIRRSVLDVKAVVSLLERAVEQEKAMLSIHETLDDQVSYLVQDYEITQTEILLCYLRRNL
jgi:hypothetical protein